MRVNSSDEISKKYEGNADKMQSEIMPSQSQLGQNFWSDNPIREFA